MYVCLGMHIVRGQVVEVGSFLLPYGSQESNSGYDVSWQVPLPAKPYYPLRLTLSEKFSHFTWVSLIGVSCLASEPQGSICFYLPSVKIIRMFHSTQFLDMPLGNQTKIYMFGI